MMNIKRNVANFQRLAKNVQGLQENIAKLKEELPAVNQFQKGVQTSLSKWRFKNNPRIEKIQQGVEQLQAKLNKHQDHGDDQQKDED